MTLSRAFVFLSALAVALSFGEAEAQPANSAAPKMVTLQMPAIPDPARVTLDPKTTALIVLDYVENICNRQANCRTKMVPAMTPFMERVRKAGLTVAYGTRAGRQNEWLKEVAPAPGDIRVNNTAQDRFYATDLDKELKAKGIKTLIVVGWKVSGSVTYTSVGAMVHGYTVVVPVDTTAAATDYETTIGFYNVLNSGNENRGNEPLKPKAVTLSRTDMITFQ